MVSTAIVQFLFAHPLIAVPWLINHCHSLASLFHNSLFLRHYANGVIIFSHRCGRSGIQNPAQYAQLQEMLRDAVSELKENEKPTSTLLVKYGYDHGSLCWICGKGRVKMVRLMLTWHENSFLVWTMTATTFLPLPANRLFSLLYSTRIHRGKYGYEMGRCGGSVLGVRVIMVPCMLKWHANSFLPWTMTATTFLPRQNPWVWMSKLTVLVRVHKRSQLKRSYARENVRNKASTATTVPPPWTGSWYQNHKSNTHQHDNKPAV
jgi:hypothetical protein